MVKIIWKLNENCKCRFKDDLSVDWFKLMVFERVFYYKG